MKFRQANNFCKRIVEAAKFPYAFKTRGSIIFQKLGSRNFQRIVNGVLNKGISAIYPLAFSSRTIQKLHNVYETPKLVEKVRTKLYLSDSNGIRTHNHLVCKRTLNHLARLTTQLFASSAKWLSVHLGTKWLWLLIPFLSLKLQIWCLLRGRSSLTFRQTIECIHSETRT